MNLETFRNIGVGVKTPVWFIQEGDILYVNTVANSGKIKRIRNNRQVNIASCKVDGVLLGNSYPAIAREVTNADTDRKSDRLFSKKSGLLK